MKFFSFSWVMAHGRTVDYLVLMKRHYFFFAFTYLSEKKKDNK